MSFVYSLVKEYLSPTESSPNNNKLADEHAEEGTRTNGDSTDNVASETTSLLSAVPS